MEQMYSKRFLDFEYLFQYRADDQESEPTHASIKEIYKYDYLFKYRPEYGRITGEELWFPVTLGYLQCLEGAKTVLDAGVGRGDFLDSIKPSYDTCGIEPSRVAIEKFHSNNDKIKNIFIQDLSGHFPSDSFDVVACLNVLEHVPSEDIDWALRSLAEVGKGYFIFSIENNTDIYEGWDGLQLNISVFPFDEWDGKLEAYFKIVRKTLIPDHHTCVYLLKKSNPVTKNEVTFNQPRFERLYLELLRTQVIAAWRQAYLEGYNSGMGDHRSYFYNKYIEDIGFYREVSRAKRIAEFAPGNGEFFEKFIRAELQKEFFFIDISESNLEYLKSKFSTLSNITYILNNQREIPIAEADTVFSFLLCQSVPKSLWVEHLAQVYDMLGNGGSYFFQFAYHPDGAANDSIGDSIAGSQKYSADQMSSLVRRAGFQSVELTPPINLEPFNTDILWYLCKAIK